MSLSTVLIGDDTLLMHCGERLLARGGTVEAVVTAAEPVAEWARGQGFAVIAPGGLDGALPTLRFDWLLSIANLRVLPESVLALPRKGAVNFHDGPLPERAGLNTPVWALIDGETTHGITWHMVEPGIDTGDVLVGRPFPITGADTGLSLNTRAFEAGLAGFDALLDQLQAGTLARHPQDLKRRRYHARGDRPAGHALLDFRQPAEVLERLVRALDHGPYRNPLALPKLRHDGRLVAVGQARVTDADAAPGMVLAADAAGITVACGTGALVLTGLRDVGDGAALGGVDIAAPGVLLAGPDAKEIAALDHRVRRIARHEGFWRDRIATHAPLSLPGLRAGEGAVRTRPLALGGADLASVALWAARMARPGEAIAWYDGALAETSRGGIVCAWVPLRLPLADGRMSTLGAAMAGEIALLRAHGGFARDLPLREPGLRPLAQPALGLSDGAGAIDGCALTVELGEHPVLHVDTARIDPDMAERLARRLETIAGAASPGADAAALPQMHPDERAALIDAPNATGTPFDADLTIHAAFEAQVDRTPDATAAIFEDRAISYAALDARANRIAHVLRARGVAPGTVVGLCLPRGIDLLAGALGIQKAGGAYLPMDPAYPQARLRHVLEDSGAQVMVTNAALAATLPEGLETLALDADPEIDAAPDARPQGGASGGDLAYLIYTSGSTGAPKGVMIEHRAVSNFFTGMDAHVPHAPGDTWLAVTSLSFDISVLELFWTLARGLRVVIAGDAPARNAGGPVSDGEGMDFSLYYWGNDDGAGSDKYRLLLEGARFADDNGFAAVWTPERHFHAFGGPYPNPSVTGAAVAALTRTIGVRGGSVVAPLHHPARIAEEWAVIDNLTNGRAGMAIASGWQPDDFVLRPENAPPDNKPATEQALDQVRRLWRGEAVEFPRADGSLHAVVTQPRPVSADLPVWMTTAGNPETWRQAGALGCHLLTHLLGQSVDEVAGKIAIYHEALRGAGHDPADFAVTLMLHTFVSDSREHAREIARGPMKVYLRAAAGLIKQYAWAFPAFKRPKGVDNAFDLSLDEVAPEELDAILDFAFERYFTESGLFGTVEDALARVDALRAIGVTEVACLIDYGIATDTVLEGLRPLARVVQARRATGPAAGDFSIAAQVARHGVTHLQCTPSMARLLLADPHTRAALGRVRHLFLGGEPLPGALVRDLADATGAALTGFYGPTEATIWSTATRPTPDEDVAGLGRAIANTQLYVLDEKRQPVPLGAEGELWIGGAGVARGYWNRPDLTAERFVENPFHGARMYRTGDLVRRDPDGALRFLGRADDQIKLRGHRIEPAEIEAALDAQEGVTQAVVIAHQAAPGDLRLVAHYTGEARDPERLRAALAARLPAWMVPARFVHLDAFPLTPNRKIDRVALTARASEAPAAAPLAAVPAPEGAPAARPAREAAEVQDRLAALWQRVLGVSRAGPRDNFFDLGGHSLLAVRVHRDIREALEVPDLTITDIFRFPVLSDLAARVATLRGALPEPPAPVAPPEGGPGTAREAAMARRRAMRARRSA
ncbi:MupA/Atu3671 family FMN-dependent luciferase-like monooxygenase [Citreimonas salinaria]|uniref:Natural product biosynthesis luciferase-like monooxygenase domain-containing protein n=1 Tax=Citreimonas salinaria TaxID=321339 RepID=A0A1H3KBS3_9RHOB|nr:MupA/Atu3671 family FMN-dependent luciferase-like monooxygenase [Citreimonas salinaria]SDY49677.1 natural product biosynthesis luciferase-like monooxygenase domain-containing protein [Citreimonas salinaria]